MDKYFVTFRIYDGVAAGKSYDERRQSLIDAAYGGCEAFWAETTSFLMISTDLRTPDFVKKITRGLSAAHDIVVVFDPDDQSCSYFGPVANADLLRWFVPLAKKLP